MLNYYFYLKKLKSHRKLAFGGKTIFSRRCNITILIKDKLVYLIIYIKLNDFIVFKAKKIIYNFDCFCHLLLFAYYNYVLPIRLKKTLNLHRRDFSYFYFMNNKVMRLSLK